MAAQLEVWEGTVGRQPLEFSDTLRVRMPLPDVTPKPLGEKSLSELLVDPAVTACIDYASRWDDITVIDNPIDQELAREAGQHLSINKITGEIRLPYAKLVPNKAYFSAGQFYWDTAYIIDGMMATDAARYLDVAKGAIGNLVHVYEHLGFIPNQSNINFANRSQPPLLSTMMLRVYHSWIDTSPEQAAQAKTWLQENIAVAKSEYEQVWNAREQDTAPHGFHHMVDEGSVLPRWGFRDVVTDIYPTIAETGEDNSDEHEGRPHEFQPVLLATLLAKYQQDFAEVARIFGDETEAQEWDTQFAKRAAEMHEKQWNPNAGWFVNYDTTSHKQQEYFSLNGFLPMWAGIATQEQAAQMVTTLEQYIRPFGLTNSITPGIHEQYQWNASNFWANKAEMVCEALARYGYYKQEARIRRITLITYAQYFQKYHALPERVNCETGDIPVSDHYQLQSIKDDGFGWTDGHAIKSYNRAQELAAMGY